MFIKFDRSVDSSALQLRRDAAIAKRPLGVQVSDKEGTTLALMMTAKKEPT